MSEVSGIQELDACEVDGVAGGVPMLVGVAIALYGPAVVKGAVAAAAFAAGAAVIYVAAHDD